MQTEHEAGSNQLKADPTSAEICAIGEALHLFVESEWSKSHKLLIESDSLLAVSWISKPQITPPSFQANIAKIRKLLDSHVWKICFAFRENNDAAQKLAKDGLEKFEIREADCDVRKAR
ncbi:hypothetical protein V6N11_013812 [Hibiscus sabdariffa]|uniref:RNase H type-1 domain-containing protein n=1 Tax=Hibiscus sabdariffa TaxID=183260 RepID=A0ABR2PD08_9ROSI